MSEADRYVVGLSCGCAITVTTGMSEEEFMDTLPPSLRCATHGRVPLRGARPAPLSPAEQPIADGLLAEHRRSRPEAP